MSSIDQVSIAGFSEPMSIAELRKTRCESVSRRTGVYLIERDPESAPKFRILSTGGWFNGVSTLRQSRRLYGCRPLKGSFSQPLKAKARTTAKAPEENQGIFPELSNFYCLPGRAGGSHVSTGVMHFQQGVVNGRIGRVKTEASNDDVPLDPAFAAVLKARKGDRS